MGALSRSPLTHFPYMRAELTRHIILTYSHTHTQAHICTQVRSLLARLIRTLLVCLKHFPWAIRTRRIAQIHTHHTHTHTHTYAHRSVGSSQDTWERAESSSSASNTSRAARKPQSILRSHSGSIYMANSSGKTPETRMNRSPRVSSVDLKASNTNAFVTNPSFRNSAPEISRSPSQRGTATSRPLVPSPPVSNKTTELSRSPSQTQGQAAPSLSRRSSGSLRQMYDSIVAERTDGEATHRSSYRA
jgi:hypothetical protein